MVYIINLVSIRHLESRWYIRGNHPDVGCSGPEVRQGTRTRDPAELHRANEILKLASVFFAKAELDHRFKS